MMRMPGNPKKSEWYSTPVAARKRKPMQVTLSDEAQERLEKIVKARKSTKSAVVESLILDASIRVSGSE
jgi:DNA-binding TFAR19-related protein (PDSD5 family)